jgi:hypothetical protein
MKGGMKDGRFFSPWLGCPLGCLLGKNVKAFPVNKFFVLFLKSFMNMGPTMGWKGWMGAVGSGGEWSEVVGGEGKKDAYSFGLN